MSVFTRVVGAYACTWAMWQAAGAHAQPQPPPVEPPAQAASPAPQPAAPVAEPAPGTPPAPAADPTIDAILASPTPSPVPAPAPPPPPTPTTSLATRETIGASQSFSYDPRSKTGDWMVAPGDTLRVAFAISLLTADGDLSRVLGTPQLALTDLALLRAAIGYSVAGKVELRAGLTALPKQPIATDAPIFQGGLVGARVDLGSLWALDFDAQAGPTIAGDGGFVDGMLTLEARYRADRFIVFTGHAGVGATAVSPADELVWLSEALGAFQVILQDPGDAAVTTGVEIALPIASDGSSSLPLGPQPRVDVHLTGILALASDWDVWIRGAVIDRGEVTSRGSMLPILDGGFDQQQLTLGVSYRSDDRQPDFAL